LDVGEKNERLRNGRREKDGKRRGFKERRERGKKGVQLGCHPHHAPYKKMEKNAEYIKESDAKRMFIFISLFLNLEIE